MKDREKAKARIAQLKKEEEERLRLLAIKENPEELAKRIKELNSQLAELSDKKSKLEKKAQSVSYELKVQQKIVEQYKTKFFGEGAKLRKEAAKKITSIKTEMSLMEDNYVKIKKRIDDTEKELGMLSTL